MTQVWRNIATILLVATAITSMVAQPVASWNETTHDFGTFHESAGKQTCQFVVTNTGDSTMVITQVKSTCGCTVASHPTDPIAPGASDVIDITFTPTGRPGPFEKGVWVYTNTTPNRTRLVIKGTVVGNPESVSKYFPVSAGDLQFTNLVMALGEVKKGLLRNSSITAYNSGLDTLVITFDNNTSHISPHAVPDTIAPGGISTMTFFFDTMRTPVWGINDDHIIIKATPLHSDKVPIYAYANIVVNVVEDFSQLTDDQRSKAPTCEVSTDKLIFDNLHRCEIAENTFSIRNTGKSNLIVRRVMSTDKAITTKCDKTLLKPGQEAIVCIKVNPDKVRDNVLNSQITIITNDPSNPRITVKVVGMID
ncbi:MAG: DUF1573 domain-containing protein [Muribaculaceae bacterium]|nr:DUF1573 domain-containing protein [Muribaculaceae bacterium]